MRPEFVLDVLRRRAEYTADVIAHEHRVTGRQVRRVLDELERLGVVERVAVRQGEPLRWRSTLRAVPTPQPEVACG